MKFFPLNLSSGWRLWLSKFTALSLKQRCLISGVALLLLLSGVYLAYASWFKETINQEAVSQRSVKVITSADLNNRSQTLPVIGRLSSVSEVKIMSESSGVIKVLSRQLGEPVSAGQIIAELDNAIQYAEWQRAKAVLASTQAQLASGRDSAKQSETNLTNTLIGTYVTADDLVNNKIDKFYLDGKGTGPVFNVTRDNGDGTMIILQATNAEMSYQLSMKRLAVGKMLSIWRSDLNQQIATNSWSTATDDSVKNLNQIRELLDLMSQAVNKFYSADARYQAIVDAYKTEISVARSQVNSTISGLIASYDQHQTKQSLAGQSTGGLSVNEATVKQAEAQVKIAEANWRKTLISSPISGQIISLPIKLGDFISPYQVVAMVANDQQLEVAVNLSSSEVAEISLGAKAYIDSIYHGRVASIAPALNQTTGSREVKVVLTTPAPDLVNGQAVEVIIEKTLARGDDKVRQTTEVRVPLSALKIEPDRTVVFTVDEKNILQAIPIKEGPIVGDDIIIKEGLTGDWRLVLDARGLKAGQSVVIVP